MVRKTPFEPLVFSWMALMPMRCQRKIFFIFFLHYALALGQNNCIHKQSF